MGAGWVTHGMRMAGLTATVCRTVKLVRPTSDAVDSGASVFASLTLSRVRSRTAGQRRRAEASSFAVAPELGLVTTSTRDPSTSARMALHTPRIAALLAESSSGHTRLLHRSGERGAQREQTGTHPWRPPIDDGKAGAWRGGERELGRERYIQTFKTVRQPVLLNGAVG
jgi:hypothetical protein